MSRSILEEEREWLEQNQVKWKKYRDEQAKLAASSMGDGTGYGLVYLAEQEILTAARIAEIQARIKMGNLIPFSLADWPAASPQENAEDEDLSIYEMQVRLRRDVKIARAKLEQVFAELVGKVKDDDVDEALTESQNAWEEYCKKQSEFAASYYGGGNIYHIIYMNEEVELITDRIAALQKELDRIKEREKEESSEG